MADPTTLKVLNNNGIEETLQVGDKVKYRVHYDYRSSHAVDTVVRFTKTRAYLQNGCYITEDGLAQGSKQNRSYIGKYNFRPAERQAKKLSKNASQGCGRSKSNDTTWLRS